MDLNNISFFLILIFLSYFFNKYLPIILNGFNSNLLKDNQKGFLQLFSLLPTSYPGHNILTEDIGALEGIDDCNCGRKGKYFSIKGRVPGTELRGCSDVY